MKLILINSFEDIQEFDYHTNKISVLLNYIKYVQGQEFIDSICDSSYKRVLLDSSLAKDPIVYHNLLLTSDLIGYDTIMFLKDIEGSYAAIVAIAAALIAYGAATTVAYIAATVIVIALYAGAAYGISLAIQALSPTPELNTDLAASQGNNLTSSLWSNMHLIREQGGITPLVFGNPFCGGVIISSNLTTADSL